MCNDPNCQYAVWGKELQTRLKNINRMLSDQAERLTTAAELAEKVFNWGKDGYSAFEESRMLGVVEPTHGLDLGER